MSCFDVVYHQSTHHPGYLAYQRSSVPNSPLKKRCRLDPDLHQAGLPSPADGLYYDRGLSFPGSVDSLKSDPLTSTTATSGALSGHSTSRSSSGVSSFSSALSSPPTSSSSSSSTSPSTSSSSCAAASSTSSSTSSVVVALKCELMTSSSASNDDDEAQQPVMTQPIGGNGVLLTYFSEDIDTNIDNHFHRALQLAQQHGGAHRMVGRFNASSATSAIAENKSQGSSCCRQESSPLSQRSFPSSFWNTVSCSSSNSSSACPSSSCSSSSSSSYHPSNGSWSSLMVSPKADPLAAAFTVSPNHPSDPYHHLNTHFASAASPPGSLGPLHQDPWNPYAFCPPPPPPSQSGYRRYRHSIHEFSFTSDSPCSLGASASAGGSHFGSSGMRYKSLLNESASAGRDDPKSHAATAADVWRSRCYGCADVTSSHIAAGFTLSGDIEVTQTALPDASVKDVYWF